MRLFLILAGLSGFSAVAMGAFGAHAFKARLSPAMMEIFKTGSHYHLTHALALLAVALLAGRARHRALSVAGWAFFAGIVIFSGSLYALAISGVRSLGAITPFGGVAFLVGWLALVLGSGAAAKRWAE